MSKPQTKIPSLFSIIISFIFLNSFLSTVSIQAAENKITTNDARPIGVWYPLFNLFGSRQCTSKTQLYNDNLNACDAGVVPAPRWGLSSMIYPLSSIKYSVANNWHTITFNFGMLGNRYPNCHVGLDIYPASSSPADNIVRAITDGTIFRMSHLWGESDTGGVDIIHQDCTGRKFIVRYGEFADYGDVVYENLRIGQNVIAGQQLGTLSQVSKHVHLELHLYVGAAQAYYSAGKWKTNSSSGAGPADVCAIHANQTNMCSSSNPAAKRLLNIRNVLWEAAEQTWPDRTFGPVKGY